MGRAHGVLLLTLRAGQVLGHNLAEMNAPPVQYVTTSDGLRIAYAVSGHGTPLLFLPGAFNHVQLAWEYPGLQAWLQGLSERFQLIQLDPRGFGMSSREVGEGLVRQDYQKDIEAVVGVDRGFGIHEAVLVRRALPKQLDGRLRLENGFPRGSDPRRR